LSDENEKEEFQFGGPEAQKTQMRGPASVRTTENVAPKANENVSTNENDNGINLFHALKKLEVALVTDDKMGIQESLDRIDDATQQVVMARTSLGSRVMTIDNTLNSLHTNGVDTKATISQLEDADAFQVISDINKTESALQATLQTSGKLIQKSLMDFIS
jgi:flagellar hook-associated protein 3 FlgL